MNFEDVKCGNKRTLSKRECFKVQSDWREAFASKVKEATGKWQIDEFLWSGFSSGIQPSRKGTKALEIYRQLEPDIVYVFDEGVCFRCAVDEVPEFFGQGLDVYIMPLDASWTAVFCHDDVFYFAWAEPDNDA